MAPDERQRISIIGGGIAGLTAAYELSRTPELQQKYRITVYQSGHLLGGKLASVRNPEQRYRNEEHGLHLWYGFYDNAFRLAREVYRDKPLDPGSPLQHFDDFFVPQSSTIVADPLHQTAPWYRLLNPQNIDEPGFSQLHNSATGLLSQMLGSLIAQTQTALASGNGPNLPLPLAWLEGVHLRALKKFSSSSLGQALDQSFERLIEQQPSLLKPWQQNAALGLISTLQSALLPVWRVLGSQHSGLQNLGYLLETFLAMFRGLLEPQYGVLESGDLDIINKYEFREWLSCNGAHNACEQNWPGLISIYEAWFQFIDGDRQQPSLEAGTATRILLRIFFSYKGALAWRVTAGMGEGLIAPLYRLLQQRGVEFEFFHRLLDVEVNAQQHLETLHFARQAVLKSKPYQPLLRFKGLDCWPIEPDWEQIEVADSVLQKPALLETKLGPLQEHETAVKHQLGEQFDHVILAIPLDVIHDKVSQQGACASLLPHQPRLLKAAQKLNFCASVAAQFWLDNCRPENHAADALTMIGWAPPLTLAADMSEVVQLEQREADGRPHGSFYLCSSYPNQSAIGTSAKMKQLTQAIHFQLSSSAFCPWLDRRDGNREFDWNSFHDPLKRQGAARLKAQYLRINDQPGDTCAVAAVDTSRYRPGQQSPELENLYFAGSWTATALNTCCVEAAVSSGLLAARALEASIRETLGDDFLRHPESTKESNQHD